MLMSSFPVEDIREEFLALQRIENGHFVRYFDAAGGTQVARSVVDAMTTYMKNGVAHLGGVYPTSRETAAIVYRARESAAQLLGTNKESIVFGANMSSMAMLLSCLLSQEDIQDGHSNIAVTEMNHRSNLEPWVYYARTKALQVNVIPIDLATYTLNDSVVETLIDEGTQLVAIDLASHLIGTVHHIEPIIQRARKVGAIIILNATHVVPYFSLDFEQMDVDVLFCSASKFFGPHVGLMTMSQEFMTSLTNGKNETTRHQLFERGSINIEGLVGLHETIQFISSLGDGATVRDKIMSAYQRFSMYEAYLLNRLYEGLAAIDFVQIVRADEDILHTPVIAFYVDGMEAKLVCHYLAQDYAIHVEYGQFNVFPFLQKIKVPNDELIRASLAPYNTMDDIEFFIEAVKSLGKRLAS